MAAAAWSAAASAAQAARENSNCFGDGAAPTGHRISMADLGGFSMGFNLTYGHQQ